MQENNEKIIRKVLKVDQFEILYLNFEPNTVHIGVNNKFRSTAQALGAFKYTQRFTSDDFKFAIVSFYS